MLEGTRELVTNLEFLGGGSGMNLPSISLPPREFSALMYYLMLGAAAAISLLAPRSPFEPGSRLARDQGDEQPRA